MTIQTIGERAATASTSAFRWNCPLCGVESALYIDKTPATGDFEAHLGGHPIQDAFELVKTQHWLRSFALIES